MFITGWHRLPADVLVRKMAKPPYSHRQDAGATILSHPHCELVSAEQSCAKMVPRKILDDAPARGQAHPLDHFRMPIKLENCRRQFTHIPRRDKNSFDSVGDNVT